MGIKGSNNEPQDTNDMARVDGVVRVATGKPSRACQLAQTAQAGHEAQDTPPDAG